MPDFIASPYVQAVTRRHFSGQSDTAMVSMVSHALTHKLFEVKVEDGNNVLDRLKTLPLLQTFGLLFSPQVLTNIEKKDCLQVAAFAERAKSNCDARCLTAGLPLNRQAEVVTIFVQKAARATNVTPLLEHMHVTGKVEAHHIELLVRIFSLLNDTSVAALYCYDNYSPTGGIQILQGDTKAVEIGLARAIACMRQSLSNLQSIFYSDSMNAQVLATVKAIGTMATNLFLTLSERFVEATRNKMVEIYSDLGKGLDSLCPKWNAYIGEEMNIALVKRNLLGSTEIAKIPGLVGETKKQCEGLQEFMKILEVPSFGFHPSLRDAKTACELSVKYAIQTISVKAAASIIVQHQGKTTGPALATQCLRMSESSGTILPKVLKSTLESMAAAEESGKRKGTSSLTKASTSKKSKTNKAP